MPFCVGKPVGPVATQVQPGVWHADGFVVRDIVELPGGGQPP